MTASNLKVVRGGESALAMAKRRYNTVVYCSTHFVSLLCCSNCVPQISNIRILCELTHSRLVTKAITFWRHISECVSDKNFKNAFLERNMSLDKIWLHRPLLVIFENFGISSSKWAIANQFRSNLWGVRILLTLWTSSVHEIWHVVLGCNCCRKVLIVYVPQITRWHR